jgi:hypothetical protein
MNGRGGTCATWLRLYMDDRVDIASIEVLGTQASSLVAAHT